MLACLRSIIKERKRITSAFDANALSVRTTELAAEVVWSLSPKVTNRTSCR